MSLAYSEDRPAAHQPIPLGSVLVLGPHETHAHRIAAHSATKENAPAAPTLASPMATGKQPKLTATTDYTETGTTSKNGGDEGNRTPNPRLANSDRRVRRRPRLSLKCADSSVVILEDTGCAGPRQHDWQHSPTVVSCQALNRSSTGSAAPTSPARGNEWGPICGQSWGMEAILASLVQRNERSPLEVAVHRLARVADEPYAV